MAHVFYDVGAVCCAVLVSCAVVCDALCSALLLQSALDGLEPLSLGLIKFRTWHLRIRKSMKSKSPKSPPGRTCARACGVAGPGTSPDDARENFPLQKPNEHESNSPRKARRPTRGERLRFLEPGRRRTGPTGVGSASIARSSRLRVFDPVSGRLCGLPGSAWAPEEGSRRASQPAHVSCHCPVKTSLSGRA